MFKILTISHGLRQMNTFIDIKSSLRGFKLFNKKKLRYYSQTKCETELIEVKGDKFVPFLQQIETRRTEARKSIIVQVQSAHSCKELHSYCSSIGSVKQMFHYTVGVEPQHFILVEFNQESDVTNLLSLSSYVDENLATPAQTHFLWFKATNRKTAKLKQSKSFKLNVENGTEIPKESEITDRLRNCSSISDQIRTLYEMTKLNELGTRLRYLSALQIESVLSGLFPQITAYPFGSSVNGYGKLGCDLDLVLRFLNKKDTNDSRLIFHSKGGLGSERTMNQKHIEVISDLIYLFLPGCGQVRKILQARIPIIKYHQQLTGIECDLSMSNMTGVHMSDFLYMMGEIDDRVRPLVFTVRKWAKAVGLTNSSPGRWITNFSLTLLMLSFLQRPMDSPSILPSLNTLVKLAGPKDKYFTEDGIDCTFLRDLNNYKNKISNNESLETLLKNFFIYYSQFDYSSKAVCLNEGLPITKPEFHPMYIVNPIERGLNVSKNVSIEEVERFKSAVQNAAWTLESIEEQKSSKWGILSLIENSTNNIFSSVRPPRLMEVKKLFLSEEDQIVEKQDKIDFKNPQVKKQISRIRKETNASINKVKNQR